MRGRRLEETLTICESQQSLGDDITWRPAVRDVQSGRKGLQLQDSRQEAGLQPLLAPLPSPTHLSQEPVSFWAPAVAGIHSYPLLCEGSGACCDVQGGDGGAGGGSEEAREGKENLLAGWRQRGRESQPENGNQRKERRRSQRQKDREEVKERESELEQKSLIERKTARKERGGGDCMSKFGCFDGLPCLQPPVSCSLWGHGALIAQYR